MASSVFTSGLDVVFRSTIFDVGPAIGLTPTFISDVIGAVGNYGEMFERNFGAGTGAAVARVRWRRDHHSQ